MSILFYAAEPIIWTQKLDDTHWDAFDDWSWDGSKWNAAGTGGSDFYLLSRGNLDSFVADKFRLTYTGATVNMELRNQADDVVASGYPYVSGTIIDMTHTGHMLLELFATTPTSITNIEFHVI